MNSDQKFIDGKKHIKMQNENGEWYWGIPQKKVETTYYRSDINTIDLIVFILFIEMIVRALKS